MKPIDYPSREAWREQRKKAAIAAVRRTGSVKAAAKALGLSRQMLHLLVPGGFHSR